ncbi:MATE family efflux transporter [Eubacteriaceae bacterium ES3]|nr:MATE family efflux transporter [Eubacteriaceae bacterium ES3]
MTKTNKAENKENKLGVLPVGKLLYIFSLPAIVQLLINSIYNIVDQIFIGQGVGYLGNAATTVVFPLMIMIMAFALMIGSGAAAYSAIKLGEKNEAEAQKTLISQFWLALVAGISLSVLGIVFLSPLLHLFGVTEAVYPYAYEYGFIILLGAPFSVMGIALSNMARADGSPKMSMYGVIIGALLNCVLDPFYMFVLGWGVKGAAIATITSQLITLIVMLVYFFKFSKSMHLRSVLTKPDLVIWKAILGLGFSAAVTQIGALIMQTVMNNVLVYYGNMTPEIGGDAALSAMGIVMKIIMVMGGLAFGVGLGAQPIFGYNLGAEKPERIKKTYLLAIGTATALVLFFWSVCQIFSGQIIQLFGGGDEGFITFFTKALRIYTFGVLTAGFQMVSSQYFQATGQPVKAAILSSLRQLVLLVPLILIFPLFWGLNGVLYAGPTAEFLSTLIVLGFMVREMKKLNQWIEVGHLKRTQLQYD